MAEFLWRFGKLCEVVPIVPAAILVISLAYRRRGRKDLAEFFLWVALVGVVCGVGVGIVLTTLSHLQSVRYDLYVNAFEGLFGYPANRIALFLARHPIIQIVAFLDYELYGAFVLVALWPVALKFGVAEAKDLFVRFLISGALVVPFYLIFPVSGPDFALPHFPVVYAGPTHVITNSSFPNCIPSEHMAMALLVLWGLRRWKWGVVVGLAHVALTVLSTLGFGQHYATDLILAIPYTWLIIKLPLIAPFHRSGYRPLLSSLELSQSSR